MGFTKDSFCSYCGTAFTELKRYPRTCPNPACATTLWANPIPVSVVLVPVLHAGRTALMVIRRAIEPRLGRLALPGGFVEEHETWQSAGAREASEEAGLQFDPASLAPLWFVSTEPRPNRVLLFSVTTPIESASLPPFTASTEASERGLVFGPGGLSEVFAFPLHARAAERFFAERGIDGAHDFIPL